MNRELIDLIEKYSEPQDFSRVAPTQESLEKAQAALNVTLPSQYVDFLKRFGDGGLDGFEIYGFDLDGTLRFVEQTNEYRKFGLPLNLVVIENCDEWVYCIDCSNGSIVSWSQVDGTRVDYPDFDSYLRNRVEDSIEDM